MPATYLETRSIDMAALTPFPGNARRGNVDVIRESVRANGQYRALVVRKLPDGTLQVLAGNHTKQALEAEGFSQARCDVIECTDDEATRIVLADNKTSDFGFYEDDALLSLLETLDDLEGTGYTPDDLDDLLAEMERVVETAYQEPTATYTETPAETAVRQERMDSMRTQEAKGVRETVLILPQEQHDELHRHMGAIRRHLGEEDLNNGETALRAVRALALLSDLYGAHEDGCQCDWCKLVRAVADPQ